MCLHVSIRPLGGFWAVVKYVTDEIGDCFRTKRAHTNSKMKPLIQTDPRERFALCGPLLAAAVLAQEFCDILMMIQRGQAQWCSASVVSGIDIGADSQQQFHHVLVAISRGRV